MSQSDAQARAQRLLFLRGMTGLSRDKMAKRYGIAKGTLQNWESARTCLSNRGAILLLRAYRAEQIHFAMDWLLHGIGSGPVTVQQVLPQQQAGGHDKSSAAFHKQVVTEIVSLRQYYADLIDMAVTDAAMAPDFPEGSYVAGIKQYCEQITALVGCDCLIYTLSHGLLLRRLLPGDHADRYHLAPLNLTLDYPLITNVAVDYAAAVHWVRAQQFLYS